MVINLDSQERIALAQLTKSLTKYTVQLTRENGNGKSLLLCSGLSELVAKYNNLLDPYTFNGRYKNDSVYYNPGQAITEIIYEIEGNREYLMRFLKEFFARIKFIEEDDFSQLKNQLEILGYKLDQEIGQDIYGENYMYYLSAYTDGEFQREEDVSYLYSELAQLNEEFLQSYKEAISTYGNAEYKSCISNCRSLIENIFKQHDDGRDYAKGILNVTGEQADPKLATPKTSQQGIFNYWLINHKNFGRYRLIVTLFSVASGLGSHPEENPSQQDALMLLRMTEDVLIWYFQKQNC